MAGSVWFKNGKIIMEDGKVILCDRCPCKCEPKVIGSFITNGSDESRKRWNLKPYQGEHVGDYGGYWRIRDVGEAHHNNPEASCSGSIYNSGTISKTGVLEGLPDEFVSGYYYDGYMELQQGCEDEDGNIVWPCP